MKRSEKSQRQRKRHNDAAFDAISDEPSVIFMGEIGGTE
jgi:hypothetical protein